MVSQDRMQTFVDKLTDEYSLPSLKIEIKDVKVGRARYKTESITIPMWLKKHKWPFVTYYLIHEVCHFLNIRYDHKGWHDDEFKKTEDEMLAKFGMKIKRARAYATHLFKDNNLVWRLSA